MSEGEGGGIVLLAAAALVAVVVTGGAVAAASGGGSPGCNSACVTGKAMAAAPPYRWTGSQWACLDELWARESDWNDEAANPDSDARGIPQDINGWADFAPGDAPAQIRWGLGYIQGRYKTPCGAWSHETAFGWY